MDLSAEYIGDHLLVSALKQGSHEAFIVVFKRYYPELVIFAGTLLPEKNDCEDAVQEAFARLWKLHQDLNIKTSLRAFLYKLVRDKCIDQLRHNKVKTEYTSSEHIEIMVMTPEDHIEYNELIRAVNQALKAMPVELRDVLLMSRREKLKNKEIAQRLNVSLRTVEYRLSKALRFIHDYIRHHINQV